MKIKLETALFSVVVISLLAASAWAFSLSSSINGLGAQTLDKELACAVQCDRYVPTLPCTAGVTQPLCKSVIGGSCIYKCTINNEWDNGHVCPNGECHNDNACSPYPNTREDLNECLQ